MVKRQARLRHLSRAAAVDEATRTSLSLLTVPKMRGEVRQEHGLDLRKDFEPFGPALAAVTRFLNPPNGTLRSKSRPSWVRCPNRAFQQRSGLRFAACPSLLVRRGRRSCGRLRPPVRSGLPPHPAFAGGFDGTSPRRCPPLR